MQLYVRMFISSMTLHSLLRICSTVVIEEKNQYPFGLVSFVVHGLEGNFHCYELCLVLGS